MIIVKKYWRVILAAWIAFVFIQSLFFKFSDSPETQFIFGTLGEYFGMIWFAKYGAYLVGFTELIASILLFSPWRAWGALLSFEIMTGAILLHLFTPLGVQMPVFGSQGEIIGHDGGVLFIMACFTLICAALLVLNDWVSESSQLRRVLERKK